MSHLFRSPLAASALALSIMVGISACGTNGDSKSSSTTGGSTSQTTAGPADSTTSATGATTSTSTGSDPTTSTSQPNGGEFTRTLEEGTHTGFLRGVTQGTVEGQTVSVVGFDQAEMLTGQAAVDAAIANGDAEPGATSLDTDYYLNNPDDTLIQLPVIPDSQIWVLDGGSPDTVPGSIDEAAAADGLYEIEVVVVRGVSLITAVEAIYLP